ncbi:MAG: hypothetical protein QNJ73_11130, partial [Gammaproteobacteria bacterium]|nr:hypothetical protein [Gammaproteobacteria bacterium]
LGAAVDKALYKDDLDLRAQVIGVENDPVVANYRVRRLLGLQEEAVNTTACFLPAGIPHSMFSRADNPGVDMFWLEAFHNGVVDFIVNGAAFPTNGEVSEAEAPWELCRVD